MSEFQMLHPDVWSQVPQNEAPLMSAGDFPNWITTSGQTVSWSPGAILTSSSTGPWTVPSAIKLAPVYATDVYMNEEGVILDAGFAKITVPKGLLKRLQAIVEMAALAGLVLPDGEPDGK